MDIASLHTYIGNYGWIETEVSTKHVRESINTLLGVLHMAIDAQMAAVGKEMEGEGEREGGGEERERERERSPANKRQIHVQ